MTKNKKTIVVIVSVCAIIIGIILFLVLTGKKVEGIWELYAISQNGGEMQSVKASNMRTVVFTKDTMEVDGNRKAYYKVDGDKMYLGKYQEDVDSKKTVVTIVKHTSDELVLLYSDGITEYLRKKQ